MLPGLYSQSVKLPTYIENAVAIARKKSPDNRAGQAIMLGALIGKSLGDAQKYRQPVSVFLQRNVDSIRNVGSTIACAKLTRSSDLGAIGSKIAIHVLVANMSDALISDRCVSNIHSGELKQTESDDSSTDSTKAEHASLSDGEILQIATMIDRIADTTQKGGAINMKEFSTALQDVLHDGPTATNNVIEKYVGSIK